TLKTIDSVRRKIPACQVVLVEMGPETYLMDTLREAADKIIVVGNRRLVRCACDSRHKGLGEAAGLLAAGHRLRHLGDYYFKLSGRYFLDDDFRLEKWSGHASPSACTTEPFPLASTVSQPSCLIPGAAPSGSACPGCRLAAAWNMKCT